MNDTQKRIKQYNAVLPHLKEKVAAVSVLLAMSATMLTTVSFAWLTLSKSPEVSDAITSIASNGNLEIALVGANEKIPELSAVGDSNKNLLDRNITWGNLVNLSDPLYGLDNLVLRPAQLNTSSLLTEPLYGAKYDSSGRVKELNSDFGFAKWVPFDGVKPGHFASSDEYGVRAISSMTFDTVGANAVFANLLKQAKEANLKAATSYIQLANNTNQMQSLATMMGLYMTARMNPDDASLSNPECAITDIKNLKAMYENFKTCFEQEAEAMAKLINVYLFLQNGESYTPCTADDIFAAKDAAGLRKLIGSTNSSQVIIQKFTEFIKDYNTISSDLEVLTEISEGGGTLTWKDSGLNNVVNNLVNVGACTIGKDNTPISSIGASNASSYLSGTQEARITNGILYRFEERTGGNIKVEGLSISATVKRLGITIPATVKANIQTTASRDYNLFSQDLETAKNANDGTIETGDRVADDTYGLAVDLWVRTNAAGSYLTLQGNVLTEKKTVPAKGIDASGNEVDLYTITLTYSSPDGTSASDTLDVYKVGSSWYNAITHQKLETDEYTTLSDATPKMEEITEVIGYEGANRVWDETTGLSVNSTTQGSGSCYVYYADTPEDQERSLKLLAGMKVVFVDGNGKLLATAEMDTEHYYAENGKVIVPLVLSSDSMVIGEDAAGNPIYAITALEQNVATRVTAIVYLDGNLLTNEDVLSSADIQGKLNIQFGSTMTLNSLRNEELEGEEIHITAEITGKTQFDYSTDSDLSTSLAVQITGVEPQSVTAFFIRAINSSQGSREQQMTFTYNSENGKWETNYTFTSPGNYILREVQLDGVSYDLDNTTLPEVTIEGFNIGSLNWEISTSGYAEVKTADAAVSTKMYLEFAVSDSNKMPKKVEGRFIHQEDKSAVSVKFTYNPTAVRWEGTASFMKSGEYVMEYVVLDGEYTALPDYMVKTIKLNLGMKVVVYTTSPHSFKYLPSDDLNEWPLNKQNLQMQIQILDDSDAPMLGWEGVKLHFRRRGSTRDGLDATLTWNPSTKFYEGSFMSEPGVFEFSHIEVTLNDAVSIINRADDSPTFTIMSPEPPSFDRTQFTENQYAPDGTASVNVHIKQSSSASVKGYFKNLTTGDIFEVIGTGTARDDEDSTYIWNFRVPQMNGTQDGKWQLISVDLWNVYDADSKFYTEDDPMIMDLENKNVVTTVLQNVLVTFDSTMSHNYGLGSDGKPSSAFMTTHTVNGMAVKITDGTGRAIDQNAFKIDNVKLTFAYSGQSATYGGYTSDQLNNATDGATIVIPLTNTNGDRMTFAQTADQSVKFAGVYSTEFTFEINGTQVQERQYTVSNLPKITVSSVAPSVKVTACSNYGSYSMSDTSATVFFKATTSSVCSNWTNYTQPTVTITMSNMGSASAATLTFTKNGGGTVHLYSSSGVSNITDAYSWTANGTCQRYVGYVKSATASSDTKEAAGTLKATQLVMTYSGMSFIVDIPDITITNNS